MKRVTTIHEQFNDSALAEEYIEGREFYVGILGNRGHQPARFIEIEHRSFSRNVAGEDRGIGHGHGHGHGHEFGEPRV